MQIIKEKLLEKANELINNKTVDRVFAWKTGDFIYDTSPYLFSDKLKGFTYDSFCSQNLSKYMIAETKNDGKILLFLKPCDSRGFALLTKEHRLDREKIYAVGIPCKGKIDISKTGLKNIASVEESGNEVVINNRTFKRSDILFDKCLYCKSKEHEECDELFMTDLSEDTCVHKGFDDVEEIEKMTSEERFDFWRSQLSKCIRCNACRNICPACSCVKCIFDNDNSGIASKSNSDSFEEDLYHIIRSFHVCGICIDCGECARVCPQNIPLQLLNRKYIKDINELYGESDEAALLHFEKTDVEPSVIAERGDGNV